MYQNLGHTPNWDVCFQQAQLTEENLRSHGSTYASTHSPTHVKADSACYMLEPQQYYRYDLDLEESDDEDASSQTKRMALRKAASMEVLKAYGGCFASGFLALQEPLPSRPQSKLRRYESADAFEIRRTASIATSLESGSVSCTSSNNDSPRPDSATLSPAQLQEATRGSKWSWRSMRKSRKNAAKKLDV
ncbi:hypothetical protein COCVIDRAFT_21996 [Bipolaris victoriae FI3]|uniref:Uncharacterized protein n=2 Tax=Bipolaris TaxID=33194 RepID=W6YXQ2_COCC2|nr:uncharacterized protein COCCADRAFT_2691 [Bipolaris zeicola 26-R-13]XP_014562063.1 hypothetical protein COCVIDRAFT_21996 [Bipolaris victoriae FI3]EUC36231.1 hypothetical protein COCCADRAFT_2691 [Bipolaris zeicola 26-R-13]